jgi:hypothetical protein
MQAAGLSKTISTKDHHWWTFVLSVPPRAVYERHRARKDTNIGVTSVFGVRWTSVGRKDVQARWTGSGGQAPRSRVLAREGDRVSREGAVVGANPLRHSKCKQRGLWLEWTPSSSHFERGWGLWWAQIPSITRNASGGVVGVKTCRLAF